MLDVCDKFYKYCKKKLAMERVQVSGIIFGVIGSLCLPNILIV
jgi:hypothetical protein